MSMGTVEGQTTHSKRGELRIYLGAAPGVGKTYAMLGEAHRRAERDTDVVVGLAETHGRAKIAALLEGLEMVPQRPITYRDREFPEMDTDAILARHPHVVVVDELAHSNVPGSTTQKRWQDVERLLAAGITVLSTVNVQHLESLNDVVERITGVAQQETVPDEVVRRADQVELVDITPQALRRRLAHGNVYPAERIDAAMGNYFRTGNLTALRELALLWLADEVEVALQRYRAEQDITDTWESRERVVVAITGGPESDTLIRRARRIAHRAGADMQVVHVLRGDGLTGSRPGDTVRYRRVAEDVGATFHTVVGEDVPAALLDFARGANATQLVLGTSRRSRPARVFKEGIGATILQHSGPIDVHMVSHAEAARGRARPTSRSPLTRRRQLIGWVLAVALPLLVTAGGSVLGQAWNMSTNVAGYVLATVAVALVGGLGPALLSALAGGVLLNYFFVPPLHTPTIAAPENLITLITMVVVAVLVALVVDLAARRATQATQARTEAALLSSYARTVLTHQQPVQRLLDKVRENFALTAVTLLEHDDTGWHQAASSGTETCNHPEHADTDIPVGDDIHLALRGRTLPAADRQVLEVAARQALMALRQQRSAAEATQAQRRADATQLRTALLSAIGHDLRTPLTATQAAVACLREPGLTLSGDDTADLLATIAESTDRLTALVDNLLDSSRIATGALQPQLRPAGYDELVARALANLDHPHTVTTDVDEHLPPVLVDPGLAERVIANLLDNALRHGQPRPQPNQTTAPSPPAVEVRASTHHDRVELRIIDHGPGLLKGATNALFEPFQRHGDHDNTSGLGLGLSVAKGFTDAMDGTLEAEDTPGGGLTLILSFPTTATSSTITTDEPR